MICDSQEDTEIEKDSIRLLGMRKVDGIVICPVGKESKHISDFAKQNIPIVTVDRCFPKLKISSVVSDNYNGSMLAVNHFYENGHRNIAFIQGLPGSSVNNERLRGFQEAHKLCEIPLNESFIVGDNFGEQSGYIGTKILLNGTKCPSAILASSNLISLGALRAISEENLRIPDDISIIAFDDQPYSEFLPTPMTTVRQKNRELGRLTIELLLNDMRSGSKSQDKKIIVPTELIVRKSVKYIK